MSIIRNSGSYLSTDVRSLIESLYSGIFSFCATPIHCNSLPLLIDLWLFIVIYLHHHMLCSLTPVDSLTRLFAIFKFIIASPIHICVALCWMTLLMKSVEASSRLSANVGIALASLSLTQIERAESVLLHIQSILKGDFEEVYKTKKIAELSKEYYSILPSRGNDIPLNSMEQLEEKFELIQLMKDFSSLNEVIGTNSDVEAKYRALQCKIMYVLMFVSVFTLCAGIWRKTMRNIRKLKTLFSRVSWRTCLVSPSPEFSLFRDW